MEKYSSLFGFCSGFSKIEKDLYLFAKAMRTTLNCTYEKAFYDREILMPTRS